MWTPGLIRFVYSCHMKPGRSTANALDEVVKWVTELMYAKEFEST